MSWYMFALNCHPKGGDGKGRSETSREFVLDVNGTALNNKFCRIGCKYVEGQSEVEIVCSELRNFDSL